MVAPASRTASHDDAAWKWAGAAADFATDEAGADRRTAMDRCKPPSTPHTALVGVVVLAPHADASPKNPCQNGAEVPSTQMRPLSRRRCHGDPHDAPTPAPRPNRSVAGLGVPLPSTVTSSVTSVPTLRPGWRTRHSAGMGNDAHSTAAASVPSAWRNASNTSLRGSLTKPAVPGR